tara:strand:- start:8875 stop:10167 length:1293 start_codon:yes stop_codon:yes gene_type:complete
MTSEKKITILIPIMRPPNVTSVDVQAINKIISKLEEKIPVRQVWIIFQNSKFKIQNLNNMEIIYFEDFQNGIEIIEKFQPKLILFDGELTIPSLTFALAGKKKQIPTVGCFFIPEIEKSESKWIKNRIQLMCAKKSFSDTKIEGELEGGIAIKFLFREYMFLLRTIKKINFNIFEWIKFFITYPRVQIFSRFSIAHHKINEPSLTLCSINSWKDKLKNQRFDSKKIKVVGSPLYDDLFNKTKKIDFKDKKLEKMKILFCTGSMHEHGIWSKKIEDELIKNTINKLNENQDYQVSLKIHPITSSIDEYIQLIKEAKLNVKLYQKESFQELMNEYDVIITYGPGSIVNECVLLGKPIVSLQIINESLTKAATYDENIINICRNLDNIFNDINDAQNKNISQKIKNAQIENMIGKFDGKCSERAASEILEIIK